MAAAGNTRSELNGGGSASAALVSGGAADRHRAEGQAVLLDRRSRPHRSPRRLPDDQVAAILRARTRRRYGPHRLASCRRPATCPTGGQRLALVAINNAVTPDDPTSLAEMRAVNARLGYAPLPDEIMMRGPLVGGGA